MKTITVVMGLLLAGAAAPARAAEPELCPGHAEAGLRREMKGHLLETMRMDQKFRHVRYGAGPLPEPRDTSVDDLLGYLTRLAPRRAAILYQVRTGDRTCSWLVTAGGVTLDTAQVDPVRYTSLRTRLLEALDVPARASVRAPVRRGAAEHTPRAERPRTEAAAAVLAEASGLLFPPPVAHRLVAEAIDTLVIVPTEELSGLPYPALPVEGVPLVERLSISVAPGFDAFLAAPRALRRPFAPAVVAAPSWPRDRDYELRPLPGALAEVEAVGALLGAKPLLGGAASAGAIHRLIGRSGPGPALVYLATHGLADPVNPLDGSVLWMASGRWTAREMSRLKLQGARPLVVLSACQTALGKNFEVGTIGLARAWTVAGAASVVISLWSVDDEATRQLMTGFVRRLAASPADLALREAMLEVRCEHADPALWASFTVYGAPEGLLPSTASRP